MTSSPLVSVIIPAYNAEELLPRTLDTVLSQTYTNLQIIIVNDCSTDNTRAVIESYTDSRIIAVHLPENGNLSNARNQGLLHASGKYIAFLDADDLWYPDKIAQQIAYMEDHPETGACFTWGEIIDEHDQTRVPDENSSFDLHFLYNCFHETNRSHTQWFFRFLEKGNCMLGSSSMIRKTVCDNIGPQNLGLRQLQDFNYWLRLLCIAPFHIIQQELTRYRRVESGTTLSAQTPAVRARTHNEEIYILTHAFDTIDDSLFIQLFSSHFRNPSASTPEELACEKAFLLKQCGISQKPYMNHMDILISDLKTCHILKETYGYTQQDYYRENTTPRYYDAEMEKDLIRTKELLDNIYNSLLWKITHTLAQLFKKLFGR